MRDLRPDELTQVYGGNGNNQNGSKQTNTQKGQGSNKKFSQSSKHTTSTRRKTCSN